MTTHHAGTVADLKSNTPNNTIVPMAGRPRTLPGDKNGGLLASLKRGASWEMIDG
jgi:hypothetical protein